MAAALKGSIIDGKALSNQCTSGTIVDHGKMLTLSARISDQ
jgi:hypothetical protein